MTSPKSKTLATWLALTFGALGAHRAYLKGVRDPWVWAHAVPSLIGAWGVQRVWAWGQDDTLAWALVPWLGLSLSAAMLQALVIGLTPDERWNERHAQGGQAHQTGWLCVIGVVLALALGATVLMSTIAYTAQKYYEYAALTPT